MSCTSIDSCWKQREHSSVPVSICVGKRKGRNVRDAAVKISSRYLLDLVYSLLTFFIFVSELIVGNVNDRFWQNNELPLDNYIVQNSLMTMAPTLATGKKAQCVLTNTMILSHNFWAMLTFGHG